VSFVALALLMQSTGPALIVPSVEETLYERGWQLVYSKETGRKEKTYIHPDSIRSASKTQDLYAVTSIVETQNKDDDGWHIGTLGYLVNCTDMTFAQEWGMGRYRDRPVLDYFQVLTFRVPRGGQLEVVKHVCSGQ
jgi:hypothetical protein